MVIENIPFFLKWKYLVYRKTQVRYQDKYIKIHNLNNPFLPVHSSIIQANNFMYTIIMNQITITAILLATPI